MQALLFEMEPRPGHEDHYFQHVATLRPILEKQDGLLFIDRFKSLSRPGVILSHSHWRDEAAIARWRTDTTHHQSQRAGRNEHFTDYRIRISQVLKCFKSKQDIQEFGNAGTYLDPAFMIPRYHVIIASSGTPHAGSGETFLSVNFDASYLFLADCQTEAEAHDLLASASKEKNVTSIMICSISRDYGMFNRGEAPQYFPDKPQVEALK